MKLERPTNQARVKLTLPRDILTTTENQQKRYHESYRRIYIDPTLVGALTSCFPALDVGFKVDHVLLTS